VLDPETTERAVDLQARSYALLRWMADTMPSWTGRIRHGETSLPAALRGWLDSHALEVPATLRGPTEDTAALANLLASYLETTFDFEPSPGERLYSPDAHCFCPMCSWMVALPRLQPRSLTRADKQRARKLRADAVRALAFELGHTLADDRVDALLDDPALRDALSLVAYARDLDRRIAGLPTTPATLALWRGFAWNPEGSPRHGYRLSARAILDAEQLLIARLG
jgi:hypothetical protein